MLAANTRKDEMEMDLEVKTFRCEPEYFIAGATIPITTSVKEAGTDIPLHAPVLLANGKVSLVTATTTGSGETEKTTVNAEGLYGISASAVKNGEDVVVYLTGEFFADGLALPEGVTAADVDVAFRNIGIFLK